MTKVTAKQIDAILPQTQCGLCGFKGCMPYAEALAEQQSSIDLCPPGGVAGLLSIAKLMGENPEPYILDMQQKAKPALKAVIREDECIGCTKCIQACPVDAILGSAKNMHTVIANECTGCELCVAPCPVDCIDMAVVTDNISPDTHHFRNRYQAREHRLQQQTRVTSIKSSNRVLPVDKKTYIEAAILRAKNKKQL